MANSVSDLLQQAKAAAQANVVVFDVSDRTQIEVSGADRARFLHSFTSNDIKKLKAGEGCESFVTNIKGKTVGHAYFFAGEQSIWIDGMPGQDQSILAHLRKYLLIEEVQIQPRTAERGELYLTGSIASQLLQLDDGLPLCGHVQRQNEAQSFDIRRVDLFGQPGYLMSIPRERVDSVYRSLTALGVAAGSADLFEAMRISAGYPRFGVDITDDNLAQEVARTKQCISFTKGCYLGQETIARLDSMGHTNRELRRIRFEGAHRPDVGTPLFDSSGTNDVGTITSASVDVSEPLTNVEPRFVAMGILKRAACQAGSEVRVTIEQQPKIGHVL